MKRKEQGKIMNRNLVIIYAYIMLECRLSLEEASRIFHIDKDTLKNNFNLTIFPKEILEALEYLEFEATNYDLDNKRGLFKANLYVRRLRKILAKPKGEERGQELEALVNDLKGPDIRFVLEKNTIGVLYTKEEKEQILKYRLKFKLPGKRMEELFHISNESIIRWERKLPECELKTRLEILRRFLNNSYKGPRSRK